MWNIFGSSMPSGAGRGSSWPWPQQQPDRCVWRLGDEVWEYKDWLAGCDDGSGGRVLSLWRGGPAAYGMRYCCYCGRALAEEAES